MGNCLVAQSGGPTTVINATIAGIITANQLCPIYEHVYGGLHGIEGILNEDFVDLTNLSDFEIKLLKQTASSALGSCRYKLKRENDADLKKIIAIMDAYEIDTLFYTGGNDSMDTVAALSEYAKKKGIENHRFIGCPKTIDNDLVITDHCPGFASCAKFLATVAKTCWLDVNSYTRKEVFILETMGRDAGWLAASTVISGKVDLLILPEETFDKDLFLSKVNEVIKKTNHCFIVVSEGAHYADGTYISASEAKNDGFEHAILGGAGQVIKNMIIESRIASRVKVQDMATLQRCYAPTQSKVDVEESFKLGMSAHMHSLNLNFTGKMVGLKRTKGHYNVKYITVDADKVANYVKCVPNNWILPNYEGMSKEFYEYVIPLIQGEPEFIYDNGTIAQLEPFYL